MNPNDPDVIALSKAIFQHESGGDFNAVGDAGTSHGAGQWQPATWKTQAKDVLGDENAAMTPDNQKAVIQVTLAKRKAAGLNPAEIAAEWNSGSPTGWENKIGTTTINGQQIKYNVPQYVKSVTDLYQQYKGSTGNPQGTSGYNPTPYSAPNGGTPAPGQFDLTGTTDTPSPTPDQSLGGELAGRVNDASTAISNTVSGKINPLSGGIQTVGALAGGLGDVVNKGLELIPGVKQVEGAIGGVAKSALDTEGGQQVVHSLSAFQEAHPELSKDISSGIDIATALPILKGLGVAKNIVGDAVAQTFKGAAEKSVTEGLTKTVASNITGRKALSAAPDGIKTLVSERALPEVVDGKYNTQEAFSKLGAQVSNLEDTELQPALDKANVPDTASRIPLEQYKKEAIGQAEDQLKDAGPIEKYFERLQKKYGDYPTLKQMNEAKRIVSKNITEAGFNSPTYSIDKIVRSTLQKSVEDGAKALGLDDVAAINQRMARLLKAQNLLKHIEGKSVKSGILGDMIRGGATAGGEALGGMTGIPFAGAYTGYKAAGYAAKKFSNKGLNILKRTGAGAERTSLKEGMGGLKGVVGGALIQKASGS